MVPSLMKSPGSVWIIAWVNAHTRGLFEWMSFTGSVCETAEDRMKIKLRKIFIKNLALSVDIFQ